jgi:hypothetical protein
MFSRKGTTFQAAPPRRLSTAGEITHFVAVIRDLTECGCARRSCAASGCRRLASSSQASL